MAFEVTKLVHGQEEALKAQQAAISLFENKNSTDNMPTQELSLKGDVGIIDFLSSLSIIESKSAARRLIEQGGIFIDNEKKTDLNEVLNLDNKKEFVVKKGKKTFVKVVIK